MVDANILQGKQGTSSLQRKYKIGSRDGNLKIKKSKNKVMKIRNVL